MALTAELKKLSTRIDLIKRRGFEIYERFADGKINKDSYLADKAKYDIELSEANTRVKNLEQRLAVITSSAKSEPIANEPILQRLLSAKELTDEAVSLVERIAIYDGDRVEIKFSFGDTN